MRWLSIFAILIGALAINSITAMSQDDPFGPSPEKTPSKKSQAKNDPFGPAPNTDPFAPSRKAQPDPFADDGNNPFGPRPKQTKDVRKQTTRTPKALPPSRSTAQRNAGTRMKLEQEVPAEFVETPLSDVLEYLGDLLEVQIYVDRRALDDAGLNTDEPIGMNLVDIPGAMALDLVLQQVDLTWGLREGVVIVTTAEASEANQVTVVYPVGDLTVAAKNMKSPKVRNATPGGDFGGFGGGDGFGEVDGGVGGGMEGMGGEMMMSTPKSEAEKLADVLQSTCSPDSWQAVGGPGVVIAYRQSLVITQTYRVHQQIEDLLEQLREAEAQPLQRRR